MRLAGELAELYGELSTLAVEGPGSRYFDIWSPAEVDQMDRAYGVSAALPQAVAIGTDGGGVLIIVRYGKVYGVGVGALAEDECWLLANSVGDFLENPEPLWRWL